jgi:hypothetical protein
VTVDIELDAAVLRTALIHECNASQRWAEMYSANTEHPNYKMYSKRVIELDRIIGELWDIKGRVSVTQTKKQTKAKPTLTKPSNEPNNVKQADTLAKLKVAQPPHE